MTRVAGLLTVLALAVSGCGGGGADTDASDSGGMPSGGSAAPTGEASDCGRIMVPGHEAVDVRAMGASCDRAQAIVEAAVGQGRQRYEAEGFTCEPADAGGGDTNYTCTRGDASIRFRYGAA